MIGVAGSGEAGDSGGFGKTVAQAVGRFRIAYGKPTARVSLAAETSYPAHWIAPIPEYLDSVQTGIAAITEQLTSEQQQCPGRPIALIGYSQGAAVINRALVELGQSDPAALQQVAAVELIADPQRIGTAVYGRGTASRDLSGVHLALGWYPADDLPASLQDRTDSFCAKGDTVCAVTPKLQQKLGSQVTGVAEILKGTYGAYVHVTRYLAEGIADTAGKNAARRVKIFVRSQSPPTAPPPAANAQDAVQRLLDVWARGDRTAAAFYAAPEVVDFLFAVPPAPATINFCEQYTGLTGEFCEFTLSDGRSGNAVTASAPENWRVTYLCVDGSGSSYSSEEFCGE